MGSREETNPSLWVRTSQDAPASPAVGDRRWDVVVVGAGIAGLTTARLLAADGASVAVVEAGPVAAGATGYTTAKITALQRTTLSEIRARHGDERAAAYAQANAAAVERVAELVTEDGIDCDFERSPACTYTADPNEVGSIEREHEAATAVGLNTRLDAETELPFAVASAVWLDDQAQFHPRRYCLGLADAVTQSGGAVVEYCRARDVAEDDNGCTVTLAQGSVTADQVVLATHLPFLDAGWFFARAHPYRSYALATRLGGERIRGMYISGETPTRSVRSTADGWTILGGEGHKVGHDEDTTRRYAALETWARDSFGATDIGFRWSAQDYETVDGMPFVGRITAGHERIWVATGFRKWGMTNATVAAMILADLLSGRDNRWAEAFDATRLAPGASLRKLVTENLDVGKRFVTDRIRSRSGPTCTYLGCRLTFNTAERSWDCPCHGSRFDEKGRVLEGPAVDDLAPQAAR